MALDDVPSLLPPPSARKKRTGVLDALEQFGYGAGWGVEQGLEGFYNLIADPYAGTQMLEGLYQMASSPVDSGKALLGGVSESLRHPMTAGLLVGSLAVDPSRVSRATKPSLLGRHPTTKADTVADVTNTSGGYSVHVPTGKIPQSGLMMGKYANTDPRNTVVQGKLLPEQVEAHAMKKGVYDQLGRDDVYLGSWKDGEQTYLDTVRRFEPGDIRKATKFGERTGQKAGYEIGVGEFPVGNWKEYLKSPEWAARQDEMAALGREYLNSQATKEWWDIRGSSLEQIYGKENLEVVAGLVAATAPMRTPRDNLIVFSEYMRRYLKGENPIQPEWRVPEGAAFRNPGSQIGNESTAKNSLLEAWDKKRLTGRKIENERRALLGDPDAVVLDRLHARGSENPQKGIFTGPVEGLIPDEAYGTLEEAFKAQAARAGRTPAQYSADVWTGIREYVKKNNELWGTPMVGGASRGSSGSYVDQFNQLVDEKAAHMGISRKELERRLSKGDATLLSAILAGPLMQEVYQEWSRENEATF